MEKLAQRSHLRFDTLGAGECLRSLCRYTLGGTLCHLFRDAVYLLGGLLCDLLGGLLRLADHFVGLTARRQGGPGRVCKLQYARTHRRSAQIPKRAQKLACHWCPHLFCRCWIGCCCDIFVE